MKLIVTGGASGLGEALVQQLSEHEVWILDRKVPQSLAPGHHAVEVDLSSVDSLPQAVEQLPAAVTALANVAGIATAEAPETVVAVNFLALRELCEQLTPRLERPGRIVNVSSIAGRDWTARPERLLPMLETESYADGMDWCRNQQTGWQRDPYTFSKRLVSAYTARLAERANREGFTVNCVSPGPIETPLYPQFESIMGQAQSDWTKAQTGRIAQPSDIAEVLALLLTSNCGWLNGVDVPVDGGYSAGLSAGWIDFADSPVMRQRTGP